MVQMNEGARSEEAPFLSSLVLFRTFPVALSNSSVFSSTFWGREKV